MYVDPVHGCSHHIEVGCVADVLGAHNASVFWIKVGGLCKWLVYICWQCSRLTVMGDELVMVCVNRNNEWGTVTMYSFSISTELL
jgi:hypothetical protein